ncbi:hypothetical protein Pan189_15550 [Stratiformator vulcanicus]|uniref:Uncharacterized protein n=2 Tax=Stratiformator vulcanicus TaxID=2527980 RepID=A0A517R024_9PLAN|nr:hypothetical protein Pan189_15550 [Stratiformator vulcanicus]
MTPAQLLSRLGRSMLQYVAETDPWVPDEEESKKVHLLALAQRQRQDVDRLVELIFRRREIPDFGYYPVDYTDLQYLALNTVFPRLIRDQHELLGAVEATNAALGSVSDGRPVLLEILSNESRILDELREIANHDASLGDS